MNIRNVASSTSDNGTHTGCGNIYKVMVKCCKGSCNVQSMLSLKVVLLLLMFLDDMEGEAEGDVDMVISNLKKSWIPLSINRGSKFQNCGNTSGIQ